MSIDGLMIRALADELQVLEGGRIGKIHQPADDELVLQIRGKSASYRLLLSANPTYPRVHLTERAYQNPLEAPMFCMLMRKYCEGGIIESLRQYGMERILHIDVRHRDELGDLSIKRIVIEIMGRHSNIILLDPSTGVILDGIHHVTPAISSYRTVLPGSRYKLPPDQHKRDPLEADMASVMEELDSAGIGTHTSAGELERWLVDRYAGISPLTAKEIVHRSSWEQSPDRARFARVFLNWMEKVRKHELEPTIARDERTGKEAFSIQPLTHIAGTRTTYPTVSACLEAYFSDKAERDRVKQRVSDMLHFLQNERNKNVKKLEKLIRTREEAKDADKYRMIGELLTAQLHRIRRGDEEAELVNYYDEAQSSIKVKLDPQLTPAENAQRYFRKYAKSKNSLIAAEEQIEAAQREIEYLDTLLAQLEHADLNDAEEIREELVAQGYLRDSKKQEKRKKKNDRPSLTCYLSSEGIEIYVGKNNLQNEYLTNRLARPTDTWLHTKDIPGSHVIIRAREYGDATLEEAAMLSAYYSKARASSNVPVDYTLIRHVRKPNGAKPGFVIYDHQKTLFVTPDEQRIKQLKMEIR